MHYSNISLIIKRGFVLLLSCLIIPFSNLAQGPYSMSVGLPSDGVEGGLDVYFQVSLDGGMTNQTGVDITGTVVLSGTATSNVDYSTINAFSIPNGSSLAILTVPVINDFEVENTESITATISLPSIGVIGTGASTANINDDDGAQLVLSIGSPVDGVEGSSEIEYTVSMQGGLINGSGGNITGDLTYTGTANSGVDFINVGSFAIADGNSSTTISITLIDDALVEVNENIVATISGVNFGTVGTSTSSALIIDDDISVAALYVSNSRDGIEGNPSVDVIFIIGVENGLINETGGAISGSISITGSATVDEDYSDVIYFDILNGESETMISIPVIDNDEIENNETVIVTLLTTNIGSIGSENEAEGIIFDEDLIRGEQVNYIVTPNGDGENDVLEIKGLNNYPVNKMTIYNRWGEPVYSAEPYSNKWQGNGRLMNGTYYYILEIPGQSAISRGYIELRGN